MQTKTIERYFFFGLLLATLCLTFLIFRPFWIVFVLGASFAIVLYPIYEWFNRNKLPSWLSSLITVLLFTVLLCGPVLGIGAIVFKQSRNVYHLVEDTQNARPVVDLINDKINKILPPGVTFDANEKVRSFVSYISNNIANIFTTTLSGFFTFLLMLFMIFYFLKNGSKYRRAIIQFSPLGKENDERIIERLTQAVNGVIRGSLLIALVNGVFLGLGFWFFGIPNSALWAVVVIVTSLIPTFGGALVTIPVIIFLLMRGDTGSAVGLFVWGIIVLPLFDNYLGPKVAGKHVNIPSILIFFSILGGMAFLGPAGILVGPMTISLLYALVSIYKNEFA